MRAKEVNSRRRQRIEAIADEFQISYFDAFTLYQVKMSEVYFDRKIDKMYDEDAELKSYENAREHLKRLRDEKTNN